MSYKIYIHTNLFNNKKYIGITSNNCKIRWGNNGEGYRQQNKFWRAIQKYGWDNFKHEIIQEVNTKKEALEIESYLINKYNTINNGYNISSFGNVDTKKVICLTTNEIFDSVNEAANKYNISPSNLSHYLKGDYDTCGNYNDIKLTWKYLNNNEENEKAERKRLERKVKRESKFFTEESLKIVELYKNGESLKKLSKEFHKSKETIKNILRFHKIEILSSKQRICHPVNMLNENKEIIKSFESLTSAAAYIGLLEGDIGRIKKACNENWRKVKGYYWSWQ